MNSTVDASCTGKVPFESFSQANAVAGRRNKKRSDARDVYHCDHCHKWHVGTINRSEKVIPMRVVGFGHSVSKKS